ncbi:MAG TPA: sigma-70 family RNA polymerase sigma factor [Gemmataceae bacterium]
MAINSMSKILQHLQRTVFLDDGAGLTDGQLLERYLHHREDAAFAALVRRHGPMVMNVCRRVLGNDHDAEDAFQASFLVLVRKAASVVPCERVGNFLYGVAHTTARRAKGLIAKRRAREKQVTEMPEPEAKPQELWDDLRPLLDLELSRLPDKYRAPIVLCDLEDRSIKEAARQLGWPQGTLAGRLARARMMLAKRLARRGLTVAGGTLAVLLSQQARSAFVPARIITGTIEAVRLFAAGQVASGLISAPVATLTEGVLKSMFLTKLKTATAVVVVTVASLTVLGGGLATTSMMAAPRTKEEKGDQVVPGRAKAEEKPDTAKTDLDLLQGVWSVISIETDSKAVKKLEKAVFMVDGKRACWQTSDSEIEGGLYLDSSLKPKTYDLAMSTRTIEGIYSLDGNTLRLCYGLGIEAKRPTRFATKSDDKQILVTLKRIFGREVFPFRRADGSKTFPTIIEKANEPVPPPPLPARQPSQAIVADMPQAKTPADVNSSEPNVFEPALLKHSGKIELPASPMPRQALVALKGGELLLLRTLEVTNEVITVTIEDRRLQTVQTIEKLKTWPFPIDMVKVYDMRGKRVDTKQLPKLLKKEIVALISSDERTAEPLNLRLFKEGTLLFVIPSPDAPGYSYSTTPLPPPSAGTLPSPASPAVEAPSSVPRPEK